MVMLWEYKTTEELKQLLAETESFPDFLNLHYDILSTLTHRIPDNDNRYFVYKNNNGGLLVILYRKYKNPPYRPRLIFCYNVDKEETFKEDDLLKIFDEIRSITDSFRKYNLARCVYGKLADVYVKWFDIHYPTHKLISNPCHLYFMTQKQKDIIIEECKNKIIPSPDGYYFDKANPEKDLDIIIDTWKFSNQSERAIIENQILKMPCSIIRLKETGDAVAWELVDPRGALNHQYVLPEHRRKGLGKAVEKAVCFKLIDFGNTTFREGKVPFKFVELSNPEVIASNEKSKYWTRWNDVSNGEALIQHWMKEEERS